MKKIKLTIAPAIRRRLIHSLPGLSILFISTTLFAQSTDTTLKEFSPFPFGASIGVTPLKNVTGVRALLTREFNSVTPEGSMKFGNLHPASNRYFWDNADTIVNYAEQNGQRIHGHTLVWHNDVPDWVLDSLPNDSTTWEHVLEDHIKTVVGRYKGRVASWDVVNEAIDENGDLRNTVWLQHLGPGYIARSFQYAHEADSAALLFYNDYGHETLIKLNAIRLLLDSLKNTGVPIHGTGMQMHISKLNNTTLLDRAIDTMLKTGLLIHISELTVALNPENDSALTYTPILADMLAQKYKFMARTVRRIPENKFYGITTWNVSDFDTYMKAKYGREDWPMPFDTLFQKKQAYQAIKDGLTQNWNYFAADGQSLSGTYTDLGSDGTAITSNYDGNSITYDNDNSSIQDIGFGFYYNGTVYNNFVLNTNGIIKLGKTIIPATTYYSSPTGAGGNSVVTSTDIDAIYPYNHDLEGTDSSEYRVYTSGDPGSRVCTIQFKNISDKGASKQYSNMNFQVKLYEGSNIIEFIYGAFTATAGTAVSLTAAVGIRGINQWESVNILKASSTAWNTTVPSSNYYFLDSNYKASVNFRFNSRNNALPDIGRTYRFTPVSDTTEELLSETQSRNLYPPYITLAGDPNGNEKTSRHFRVTTSNPIDGSSIRIRIEAAKDLRLSVTIQNQSGQLICTRNISCTAGLNYADMPVSAIPPGIYLMNASDGEYNQTVRLLKAR